MKDIYENWKLYKEEIELLQELENIFLEHSEEDLLNENVMAKVIEKVNDFMLKLSMKVIDMAKKAGSKALSLLSGAAGIVKRFANKYPTLAKIVGMLIAAAAAYALMAGIDPSIAQADVSFDGKMLSQEELDAFEGIMQKLDLSAYGHDQKDQLKLAAKVKQMYQSPNVEEFSKNMDGVAGEVSALIDKLRTIAKEDPERYKGFVKAGENFSVNIRGASVAPTSVD
jgi:hypothetical protein